MELKYALLSDKSGIPIASFDLANGDVITDEVLFSGFITAIQAFMGELEVQESRSKHGLIQAGTMQIAFNRGEITIGVLVGHDIDSSIIAQLEFLVNMFEESIGYDFGFWSANDLLEPFIDTYWRNLLRTFRDQVYHDYYIPFLNIDNPDAYKERIQDEDVDVFLSHVDGKRSLREISWISNIDWNQLTLMISGMIDNGSMYLEVSQSKEQTFYITNEGLNVLLGKSDPPVTILDIWDEVGVILLNEIHPNRPMGVILHRMRDIAEIFGEEIIFGVLKELLHELLVKPHPSIYQLSTFLQNYCLSFYQIARDEIDGSLHEEFLNMISSMGKLSVLYPSFLNDDLRDPIKMYELIKDLSWEDLAEFIRQYLRPINDSFMVISSMFSESYALEIRDKILNPLKERHKEMIEKLQLDDLQILNW